MDWSKEVKAEEVILGYGTSEMSLSLMPRLVMNFACLTWDIVLWQYLMMVEVF